MHRAQTQAEIDELYREYRVDADIDERWVLVSPFTFPKGWTPRTSAILYVLPPDYPQHPPKVYIPEGMRYRNRKTLNQLRSRHNGWNRWCTRRLEWRPYNDSLYSLTELMKTAFASPGEHNPVEEAATERRETGAPP